MEFVSNQRANIARSVAVVLTLTAGFFALGLAQGAARFTTYAGASGLATTLFILTGLALTAAGIVTSFTRPGRRIGALALIAGFLWFGPVWIGWQGGPTLIRSVGMLVAAFSFAVLLHVILAYPSGRTSSAAARILIAVAYIEAAIAVVGLALVRDPYFDVHCWTNCTTNSFLIRSLPALARKIELGDRWFTVAAALILIVICATRILRRSGPARRSILPVAAPAIVFAGAVVARALTFLWVPTEDPSNAAFLSIYIAGSVAVLLIAGGLLSAAVRTRLQRRAVAGIATSVGEAPPPGALASSLAVALGDPDLRIAYWLSNSKRYVDGNGHAVDAPTSRPGGAITTLVRDDHPIAVVSHAAALSDLEREIGPAVRLALENERLQAEVLAHLEDIRASRARIVETGDAARSRLERNLHDGAQQRLLALSYDIRVAKGEAERGGDAEAATMLASAGEEAQQAIVELREIAHGIFPAVLTEAGLTSALWTLADEAPIPVEVEAPEARFSATVERTAYAVAAGAVDDAARSGLDHVNVLVRHADHRMIVEVDPVGRGPFTHLADRVGAAGGHLLQEGDLLRAEIPLEEER